MVASNWVETVCDRSKTTLNHIKISFTGPDCVEVSKLEGKCPFVRCIKSFWGM